MKKRFAIGIDPGVSTGFAYYDRELKRVDYMDTLDFWKAFDCVLSTFKPENAFVVIEAPKKTRLYERQDKETGQRRREKMAANVGSNAREAELLADGIERLGFEVRRVRPSRTKLKAAEFQRQTGIRTPTNQHVRDAVMLVYGL